MASDDCRKNPLPDDPIKKSASCPLIDIQKTKYIVYPLRMRQAKGDDRERDRRVNRTRAAVTDAFIRLIFEHRYDTIRTAHLIAEADIGRSTFYEHFRSKDDVLLSAVGPVLRPLASAATGRGAKAQVVAILSHMWDRRSVGRVILGSATGAKMQRALAAMILDNMRKGDPGNASAAMQAAAAAAAQMAMLRLWVKGEVSCTADALAGLMIGCAAMTRATL
jgi:AcrR family transcriptional regulator